MVWDTSAADLSKIRLPKIKKIKSPGYFCRFFDSLLRAS